GGWVCGEQVGCGEAVQWKYGITLALCLLAVHGIRRCDAFAPDETPSDLCNTVTCNCNRLRREKLVLWNYADTERIRLAGAWGDDLPHDFRRIAFAPSRWAERCTDP